MRLALLGVLFSLALNAQNGEDSFKVYTDHPRLFIKAQRLRLLKRERERQSMRWMQFETLIKGGAQMPEPGFALALYYSVTGDVDAGKRAVEAVMAAASDVRQSALVYDWCHSLLTPVQLKTLSARLSTAAADPSAKDIRGIRNRALAAIAMADESADHGESALHDVVDRWWKQQMAPALKQGRDLASGDDTFALLELLHAIRDNLNIDLRETAGDYFKHVAEFYVTSHYPAPFPAAENEYRIPVYRGSGQPDLNSAAMSRAAGLALVAYDTNALENQYVQGWLMQDRFLLRGTLGCPYEFLWANPYQPGLSYAHLPLIFHDERSGDLFVRSSWDEDATWFGLYQGEAQVFRDGRITVLRQTSSASAQTPRIEIGDTALIVLGKSGSRFTVVTSGVFVIGLKPHHGYEVEVDDEELTELETDRAGTLQIGVPKEVESGVLIREVK